jgi:2'-5' RNA ligase
MLPARYALYFVPDSAAPLWRFGSAVIGYDATTGGEPIQLVPTGYTPEDWRGLTAEPRRYGFHATVKAPFRLAAGLDEDALVAALHGFARAESPFTARLRMSVLGDFVALTPADETPAIAALERRVVDSFEPFRAPLAEEEIARRQRSPLSPRQRDLLARYGYPYVHEEFRFHMTLTGRVLRPVEVAAALEQEFLARVPEWIEIDRLAVFKQASAEDRFRMVAVVRFSLC